MQLQTIPIAFITEHIPPFKQTFTGQSVAAEVKVVVVVTVVVISRLVSHSVP